MRFTLLLAFFFADPQLPLADRESGTAWLASLDVKSPPGGLALENPWAQPFTHRSLVVPVDWFKRPTPERISAEALRQDLAILKAVMANTYGGWDSAKRLGLDWDAFFRDADASLEGKGDIPTKDAFAFWNKLMAVQLDNHSGPIPAYGGNFFPRSAQLKSAPKGVCTEAKTETSAIIPLNPRDPAQQPRAARDAAMQPVDYIAYPNRQEFSAVHCGDQWVEVTPSWKAPDAEKLSNILALAETPKDVPSFRRINRRIAYLRLPTFSKSNNELLLNLAPLIKSNGEKLLIVDLRRNSGGDIRINAVSKWVKVPGVNSSTRLSKSCLYPHLRWGYAMISSKNIQPPISDSLRGMLQSSADALMKPSPDGCPSSFKESQGNWNFTKRQPWAKSKSHTRILALVDNGCGSDCEYAVLKLSAIPGAVFAGQNTYGVVQFIQPGYFVLPNTKHVFRVALGTSDPYGDQRSFDGYGFDVDLLLTTRESQTPAAILQLAERLLDGR